jgi:hypothetical protein
VAIVTINIPLARSDMHFQCAPPTAALAWLPQTLVLPLLLMWLVLRPATLAIARR